MSDIINTGHAGLWGLINDKNGGIDLPKPFEHDIFRRGGKSCVKSIKTNLLGENYGRNNFYQGGFST